MSRLHTRRARILRRLHRRHGQHRSLFAECDGPATHHCPGACSDPIACCRCTCPCHREDPQP